MKIWLNNFLFGDASVRVYLDEPITGLELPTPRTSRGNRFGQAGSYIAAQVDDARFITLNGHIFASNITEAKQKRRDMQAALPLYPSVITMNIQDDDGRTYTLNCQYVDFKMPINQPKLRYDFKIDLEAPNPTIFDTTAGSAINATINKAIPGGFQFTSTSPEFGSSNTFFFAGSQSSSTVNNTSPNVAWPVITITGQTTNPVLVNTATGETFSLTGYSVSSSDVTVIDMYNHTVTLNGGNAYAYVASNSIWWGLQPGANTINFTTGSGSDVSSAAMTFRPGYRGI